MSRTFTKLFSSITESTVWCEPDRTRLVWIAMLAMADHAGRVWSSVPGLANRARVPLEDCETALETFLSPDPYSRTPDHEGRRIEPIDGGWRLLNHAKYRQIRDDESIKESKRRYINERRAAEKAQGVENVEQSRTLSTAVDRSRANAEAETEAEAEKAPLSDRSLAPTPSAAVSGQFEGHNQPHQATPNPVAAFARAMIAAGFRVTAMNPDLVAYVKEGGTVEHLQQVMALPECVGKPATYAVRIARREVTQPAAQIQAQGDGRRQPVEPRRVDSPEATRAKMDAAKPKRAASDEVASNALQLAQDLIKGREVMP